MILTFGGWDGQFERNVNIVDHMFVYLWNLYYGDWARFIQLPKDYYRPNWDCTFFDELAFNANGTMTIEVENFTLCMAIFELKQWLSWPGKYEYPFKCGLHYDIYDCKCTKLLAVVFTDNILRRFFENRGVELIRQTGSFRIANWDADQMKDATSDMKIYSDKLMTGEEMVSRLNRALNVLSAM